MEEYHAKCSRRRVQSAAIDSGWKRDRNAMPGIDMVQSARRATWGFTMLEVLVSMFIMAVGILGMVSLQITSLNVNRDALMNVEANQLISDLMDRIIANPAGTYGPVALGDTPVTGLDCTLNNCTTDQMATYDISRWLCAINSEDAASVLYPACALLGINGAFPQGKGSITLVGNEYRILLQWKDKPLDEARYAEMYLQVN